MDSNSINIDLYYVEDAKLLASIASQNADTVRTDLNEVTAAASSVSEVSIDQGAITGLQKELDRVNNVVGVIDESGQLALEALEATGNGLVMIDGKEISLEIVLASGWGYFGSSTYDDSLTVRIVDEGKVYELPIDAVVEGMFMCEAGKNTYEEMISGTMSYEEAIIAGAVFCIESRSEILYQSVGGTRQISGDGGVTGAFETYLLDYSKLSDVDQDPSRISESDPDSSRRYYVGQALFARLCTKITEGMVITLTTDSSNFPDKNNVRSHWSLKNGNNGVIEGPLNAKWNSAGATGGWADDGLNQSDINSINTDEQRNYAKKGYSINQILEVYMNDDAIRLRKMDYDTQQFSDLDINNLSVEKLMKEKGLTIYKPVGEDASFNTNGKHYEDAFFYVLEDNGGSANIEPSVVSGISAENNNSSHSSSSSSSGGGSTGGGYTSSGSGNASIPSGSIPSDSILPSDPVIDSSASNILPDNKFVSLVPELTSGTLNMMEINQKQVTYNILDMNSLDYQNYLELLKNDGYVFNGDLWIKDNYQVSLNYENNNLIFSISINENN